MGMGGGGGEVRRLWTPIKVNVDDFVMSWYRRNESVSAMLTFPTEHCNLNYGCLSFLYIFICVSLNFSFICHEFPTPRFCCGISTSGSIGCC